MKHTRCKLVSKGLLFVLMLGLGYSSLQAQTKKVHENKTIFTAEELESLGAGTIQEALNLINQESNQKAQFNPQIIYHGLELNAKSKLKVSELINTLPLEDVEKIEVVNEGKQIKYHLSKTLTKDGVTALVTFTLFEKVELPSQLNPVVSTPLNQPVLSKQIANQVKIIDAEQLQTLGIRTVEEALNTFSDIIVRKQFGVQTISMRGLTDGNTKVLFNGVNLQDTMGVSSSPHFALIPIDNVDRIEIVGGSNSVNHGAGSIAGVINIISNQKTRAFFATQVGVNQIQSVVNVPVNLTFMSEKKCCQVDCPSKYGFHQELKMFVQANQSYDKTKSALSIGTEKDAVANQSLTIGLHPFKYKKIEWSSLFFLGLEKRELDESESDPDDPDYDLNSNQILFKTSAKGKMNEKVNWSSDVNISNYIRHNKDKNNGEISIDAKYKSNLKSLQTQLNIDLNPSQHLIVGGKASSETGEQTGTYGNLPKNTQQSLAIYTQHRWLNPYLSTQLGGRIESYSLGEYGKSISTYQASVFRDIPVINIKATATIKTGFKLPSIYQRFHSENGNKDLKAEQSETKEVSLEKTFKKVKLSTTYFESDIKEKINWVNLPPLDDWNIGKYVNINQESVNGMEYNLDYFGLNALTFVHLSYTTFETNSSIIPNYKLTSSLGFKVANLTIGLSFNEFGKTKVLPKYNVTNLTLNTQFNQSTTGFMKINNVFDKKYETVKGYTESERNIVLGFKWFFLTSKKVNI